MTFVVLFAALSGQLQPANPYNPPPAPMPALAGSSPSDLILAASLLDTPDGVPEPTPPAGRYAAVRDALHTVAVDREILDVRETKYVLVVPAEFSSDLNMLRRRAAEFAGAPPVGDSHRFPPRDYVNEAVRFNRAFRKKVEELKGLDAQRASVFAAVGRETDECYAAWDLVRDARCEFYHTPVRRRALVQLRALLGEEAYLAAELPPCVPVHRFHELRY